MHKKKLLFVMLALMLIFNLVSVDSVVYAERLSASAESTLAENISEVVDEDQKSDLLSTVAQEEEASPEAATATTAEPEKEETEKEEEETVLTDQISESEEVVSESSADLKSQTVSDEFLPFADGEESLLPPLRFAQLVAVVPLAEAVVVVPLAEVVPEALHRAFTPDQDLISRSSPRMNKVLCGLPFSLRIFKQMSPISL